MFIDTHCHCNMMVKKDFDVPLRQNELDAVGEIVQQARDAGVIDIINVGTSLIETNNSIAIAKRYEHVYAVAGIHPCDCKEDWREDFAQIKALVKNSEENKIVAVGETGLDFYHRPYDKQRQIDAFKAHIELALTYDLPLVLHIRDAASEVLRVLEEYKAEARGVYHCFAGNRSVAETFIEWGFYLGIDAPITYPKNDEFRGLIRDLPLDHLILETDAPFLPPQQYRGKQNHPKYIPVFAQVLADLKRISLFDLAAITTTNAKALFKI